MDLPRPVWQTARWIAALAGALGTVVLLPGVAGAHAFLVSSSPRPGERLEAPPVSVELRFTEAVVPGSVRIEVRTDGNRAVDAGPSQLLEGGLGAEVLLPRLRDGVYVVSWRARSAVDGHDELGEFAFAVGVKGPLPPTATTRRAGRVAWPQAVASWPAVVGLLLAAGGLVSERWIWSPVATRLRVGVPRLPVGWLLGLSLAGVAVSFLLLVGGGSAGGTAAPPRWASALATPAGLSAAVQGVATAYGLWMLVLPRIRPWAVVPLGLAIAAAAVRSHAASGAAWWALPANVVHLGAAAVWSGALAHLILVAWRLRGGEDRDALVEGARRYAALALWLVALVLATGVLVALPRFSTPGELLGTTYGRILLVKLALVVATLALATAARRRALGVPPTPRIRLLRLLVRPEGALLLAVITAATVLANAAPPRPATAAGVLLGPPPLEGPVVRMAGLAGSPLAVHLAAARGRLRVEVVEPSRRPATDARIELEGRSPGGREVGIEPRVCGPGCATTRFDWQTGTTGVAVRVASNEWGEGTAHFSVPWPPRPERPGLLRRVVEAMRAQPRVVMVERVSSGPGASARNTAELTGERFVAQEVYASGGATDVRLVPSSPRVRRLTLFLPGSWIWVLLEIGPDHRLARETIVSPGHQIERSFSYPSGSR